MSTRQIVLLGGFAAVILTAVGVLKIKHGILIGGGLVAIGYMLPDTASAAA